MLLGAALSSCATTKTLGAEALEGEWRGTMTPLPRVTGRRMTHFGDVELLVWNVAGSRVYGRLTGPDIQGQFTGTIDGNTLSIQRSHSKTLLTIEGDRMSGTLTTLSSNDEFRLDLKKRAP
jgi:hypothetical protein